MSSTHTKRKKSTSQDIAENGVVRFALRDPDTGLYWDCKFNEQKRSRHYYGARWNNKGPKLTDPTFLAQPHYYTSQKALSTIFSRYEVERQIRDEALPPLPKLEMVELRAVFQIASVVDIEIDDNVIQVERFRRKFGEMVANAAETLARRGERLCEFNHAIKRKGCSLMKLTEMMPTASNAGMITFLRTDSELVQAQLLISEQITKTFKLK